MQRHLGIVVGVAASLCGAVNGSKAGGDALTIDTSKVGQPFHGLGGISGGGATSRLLVDYVEPQRSQILDYLFKPNYGANLQILKVEIGGDSQSTDGCEASHMHSADDLDYTRGYEWWLLTEAKKRNPDIKTYGLPWAYPAWVGGPELSGDPFKHPELTSRYILKWLEGARKVYNVEIDYIGIWNERSSDAKYAKTLRKTLDDAGFANTTLVARDGKSDICDDMSQDKGYADAIGVVGLHYPRDNESYKNCRDVGFGLKGGKPMWASEESSSYDDFNGAACWARVVTSHWVQQGMTASIMWNLVGAYFHGTAYYATSMFTAVEPWSGNYNTFPVLWATAHITQFTKVGWNLIEVGSGSGQLPSGGFYATYADPAGDDWTLTVVKISEDHAHCVRPGLPPFDTAAENVTFKLAPSTSARKLAVWRSNFEEYDSAGDAETVFQRLADISPSGGSFTLEVKVGDFYTVSTITDGPTKGTPETPIPKSEPMVPLPYSDSFETVQPSQEGKWWSDQIGVFEVHYENGSSGNKVMRQMVPTQPIGWSDHGSFGPVSVMGMREWQDIKISARVKLPLDAPENAWACIGTRADQLWDRGIVLCVNASGGYVLSSAGPKLWKGQPTGEIFAQGSSSPLRPGVLTPLSLTTIGQSAFATLDGASLFENVAIRDVDTGFAAIGSSGYFAIEFDDVSVEAAGHRWNPKAHCPTATIGAPLRTRDCEPNGFVVEDEAFELLASWGIRHIASGLCVAAADAITGAALSLRTCDPSDLLQQFKNRYTFVRNSAQPFLLKAGDGNLRLFGRDGEAYVGDAYGKNGTWSKWSYFPNSKQLRNQYVSDVKHLGYPQCLTACGGAREIVV